MVIRVNIKKSKLIKLSIDELKIKKNYAWNEK